MDTTPTKRTFELFIDISNGSPAPSDNHKKKVWSDSFTEWRLWTAQTQINKKLHTRIGTVRKHGAPNMVMKNALSLRLEIVQIPIQG